MISGTNPTRGIESAQGGDYRLMARNWADGGARLIPGDSSDMEEDFECERGTASP